MAGWIERQVSSRVLHRGRVITVRHDEIALPDGRRSTRDVVDSPGAVGIVALDERGCVLLVRQYRYACGKVLTELPAGMLMPGEEPLQTARRELEEETGYTAGRWTYLGTCFTSPGYASSQMHLFLAQDLTPGVTHPDEEEHIELLRRPWDDAIAHLAGFEDAKTIAGLALAAAHLAKSPAERT